MITRNAFAIFIGMIILGLLSSCGDDDTDPMLTSAEFTVTIENVISGKDYFDAGSTGFLMPGESAEYTFDAGIGHRLSFATMYVQSNDLFFAPEEEGLPLYDASGNPTVGDITSFVHLWDAGTEVNEEPGVGPNQAPRQAGPNTGTDENGTVALIEDVMDGFTYPDVADLITFSLAHDGGTRFTLTIDNTSAGSAIPSPVAPGAWVVNSAGQTPLFTAGSAASMGLEGIAEDGNNEMTVSSLEDNSGYVSPLAPGAFSIGENTIFTTGTSPSAAIEALAEDGDPSGYTNVFNTPVGSSDAGPIFPGDAYEFTFTATQGDQLSFASMLVQSNDWFVGADAIDLFNGTTALSGDITGMVNLYDAGSETDEFAGAGNNQPVRQSGGNIGTDENGNVTIETNSGAHVPAVNGLVRVSINAN